MSDLETNQEVNINVETHNSNESSSSLITTTSAQNEQPQTKIDNSKTSDTNISYPPPPSSSSDDDYDDDEDYIDDQDYDDDQDYSYEFGYDDYGDELDLYDSYYNEEGDEDLNSYLPCTVCEKMKLAVTCASCPAVYCRRDAVPRIQLTSKDLEFGEKLSETNHKFIMYECNGCFNRTNNDFGEWRESRKVLTLEMLCAFNIARKMWETIYADENLIPLPFKVAMGTSLSLMNSVDQSYADSPLPIRNLIKRAVFLLGLELDFFATYENKDTVLASLLNGEIHKSICENIYHVESSSEGKSSYGNGENDDAEKSDNSEANDKNDCWEDHEIEWTPQFTIKKLDDRDV